MERSPIFHRASFILVNSTKRKNTYQRATLGIEHPESFSNGIAVSLLIMAMIIVMIMVCPDREGIELLLPNGIGLYSLRLQPNVSIVALKPMKFRG